MYTSKYVCLKLNMSYIPISPVKYALPMKHAQTYVPISPSKTTDKAPPSGCKKKVFLSIQNLPMATYSTYGTARSIYSTYNGLVYISGIYVKITAP
jgi:hypothetical protein